MSSKQYFQGWPNSGQYYETLNNIYFLLYNYLINFPRNQNCTVIFDIDDTLVYTDSAKLFKNAKFPNKWISGYMLFPEIPQIAKIAILCKNLGFKVIILTARPYDSEKSSKKNLEILGIKYDEMYHNLDYPNIEFKIKFKNKLSKTNNIILSVGDQWPDIEGSPYGTLCIKLPSQQDHKAYFTNDNIKYYKI